MSGSFTRLSQVSGFNRTVDKRTANVFFPRGFYPTGFFSANKILVALTALADPVEIVEVTADVIPQPAATSVQHDAVLLAVVVVRLVLAP